MSLFIEDLPSILRYSHQRFLNQVDLREDSKTLGYCDRDYWAWKVKDFSNGSWQASLVGLLDTNELSGLPKEEILKLVGHVIKGTKKLQRSNGSFEEAYPYESSFAVTAMVAFYFSYLKNKHSNFLTQDSENEIQEVIQESVGFLKRTPETHGVISNHLATAYLAMWLESGDVSVVEPLFNIMDKEGWFPEYDGADPGYQTLLLHYFAMANSVRELPDTWVEKLESAGEFCSFFFQQNGNFAGDIGSRGTSIFYLGASSFIPTPQIWIESAYKSLRLLSPVSVDSGNFATIYTTWSFFYRQYKAGKVTFKNEKIEDCDQYFNNANLYCFRSSSLNLLVSFSNGVVEGIRIGQSDLFEDISIPGFKKSNWATRGMVQAKAVGKNGFSFKYSLVDVKQKLPNAFTTILLRVLGPLFYFLPIMHRLFKRLLKRFVMGSGSQVPTSIEINFDKSSEQLFVKEAGGYSLLHPGFYEHMASANSFSRKYLRNVPKI